MLNLLLISLKYSLLLNYNGSIAGNNFMSKLLSEWVPSQAALDLIKLNGITDDQIAKSVEYLKSQSTLDNIDDVEGYDNWNTFFILFCIKANTEGDP